jgi:broad specificity phosphatase PhoE
LGNLSAVWASTETKAIEAAGILAGRFGLPVHAHHELHENDRSATGCLSPPEFGRMADAFFARPEENVRGWERAVDAQARVAAAVDEILKHFSGENIAFVAHGGVGTVLLCKYLGADHEERWSTVPRTLLGLRRYNASCDPSMA